MLEMIEVCFGCIKLHKILIVELTSVIIIKYSYKLLKYIYVYILLCEIM